MERHEAALIMYEKGATQKEIARILHSTEKTIGNWKVKYQWDEKVVSYSINKKTSEDNALVALSHQTRIIRLIAEKLGEQVNTALNAEELAKLLIPKGEIDAVQKLFTTIRRKEAEWGDKVKEIREFLAYLKDVNLPLAQQLTGHADNYLNETRK